MKKYFSKILFSLFLCVSLIGCSGEVTPVETDDRQSVTETELYGFEQEDSRLVKRGQTENISVSADGGNLEVHFLDVGQGDSILIRQGDAAMLIDAGNNDKGTTVWSYLLSQNIEALDYAIGTHPDADHIGGLDVVLYKLNCNTVFLPACENDTQTYRELIQTIGQRNQKVTVPEQGDIYSLGAAQFQILTDTGKDYGEDNNNYSIAIRVIFGDTSFLFTGDAEVEAEKDMLASGIPLAADVYKAAHHGANNANTEDFLNVVNPKYCVISCGEDNSYGHPRAGFLNIIRAMGVKVFRTDEQGTIVAVSDGEEITFSCSPSTTWKSGEPTGGGEIVNDLKPTGAKVGQYVINTSTHKFHRLDCASVEQMSDKNKKISDQSREELLEQGYEPCKNCEP